MGVSYAEHRRKRALPYPRYRVNWYDCKNCSWHEVPTLYYESMAAIRAAQAYTALLVRVGVLEAEKGGWVYHSLESFTTLANKEV